MRENAVTPKTDIEIARASEMLPIGEIASAAGIPEDAVEPYGKYKAKIDPAYLAGRTADGHHLILVTAMTPTPAGEGKTTMTVGLADGLQRIGKRVCVALREPSLGPAFGIKGGAAGGGYAQVVPMEDINLHFTGDLHAITSANNLLAAMVDNHIKQGNALRIDPQKIVWRRCLDMNDRQLRNIVSGLGGSANGFPKEEGFDITAASEVMATFCMASGLKDLTERLGKIIVGYTNDDGNGAKPVTAADLKAKGAMTVLLKDALKPNLVQTLEHVPAIIHGGPFANIAHGCNSVIATKTALQLGEYAVTEAGFGADLGAEKFLDIKCRVTGLRPDCVVMVATVRALKQNGGVAKANLNTPDPEAVKRGLPNLMRHLCNIRDVYHLPCVAVINVHPSDTEEELELVRESCREAGFACECSTAWADGGKGSVKLAEEVAAVCERGEGSGLTFSYDTEASIEEKLTCVVRKIYHGRGVELTAKAKKQARELASFGYGNLPVCIAKTQYSFSDDPKAVGAPEDFTVTVRNLKVSAGAGFLVALTGDIMTMPGLPSHPAAELIGLDDKNEIVGLF